MTVAPVSELVAFAWVVGVLHVAHTEHPKEKLRGRLRNGLMRQLPNETEERRSRKGKLLIGEY